MSLTGFTITTNHNEGRIVEYTLRSGDSFLVTGIDTRGKRFRIATTNYLKARAINVWKGSVWLIRNNKRHLLGRYTN